MNDYTSFVIIVLSIAISIGLGIGAVIRTIIECDRLEGKLNKLEDKTKTISIDNKRSMSADDKIFSLLRIITNPAKFNKYELILSDGMHILGNVNMNTNDIYDQSTTIEFMTDLAMQEVINICYYALGMTPIIRIIKSKSGVPIITYILNCESHAATLNVVTILSHNIREIYNDTFYLYKILDSIKNDVIYRFNLNDMHITSYNNGTRFESDNDKINIMLEEIEKNV